MAIGNLRREEAIGLTLAVGLHASLLGLLALHRAPVLTPSPQPISVTLSTDVGVNAAAPTQADAAADQAPTLGAPPAPSSPPSPLAAEVSAPPEKVETPPIAKVAPAPKPVAVARVRPVAVAHAKPEVVKPPEPDTTDTTPPKPAPKTPAHKARSHQLSAAAKPSPSVKDWDLAAPAPDRQPVGASRIGNDFLKGVAGGKASGKARQQGAATIGPEVKSSLAGAIARQLKPHWTAPQGADADKLVTILAWDLNRDGSLAGAPRVVRQDGISDSNRPQAARHAEQAIRAVELATPFQLPPEYYDLWKHVGSSRFDRTLSQ